MLSEIRRSRRARRRRRGRADGARKRARNPSCRTHLDGISPATYTTNVRSRMTFTGIEASRVSVTTSRATSSPPPLAGEGQGGGITALCVRASPLPNPPPAKARLRASSTRYAREGADRVCRLRQPHLTKIPSVRRAVAAVLALFLALTLSARASAQ